MKPRTSADRPEPGIPACRKGANFDVKVARACHGPARRKSQHAPERRRSAAGERLGNRAAGVTIMGNVLSGPRTCQSPDAWLFRLGDNYVWRLSATLPHMDKSLVAPEWRRAAGFARPLIYAYPTEGTSVPGSPKRHRGADKCRISIHLNMSIVGVDGPADGCVCSLMAGGWWVWP